MRTGALIAEEETRRGSGGTWAALQRLRGVGGGQVILVLLFLLMLPVSNPRIYAVDEVGYYVYLRSLYFDGDLDFENEYRTFDRLNPKAGLAAALLKAGPIKDGGRRNERTGLYGNTAPVGSALLWSPFYVLADGLVRLANLGGAGIPADGYSWPYIWAVCYASALYGFGGVLLCQRLAARFVSPFAATLAAATVWLASPLVFYMVVQMPWSHAPGLCMVACFLSFWNSTRGRRTTGGWLVLGALGGLMTLVREQYGLFMLVPALEAVVVYGAIFRQKATGKEPKMSEPVSGEEHGISLLAPANRRSAGFWPLFVGHCLFVLAFALTLAPQLVVYQVLNGEMRPSTEVSGKFDRSSPCFFHTLVDPGACRNSPGPAFSHGALLWSPVLGLGLVGLLLLWRRDRLLAAALLLAFLAQTYVNGAIYTWHLSGAFGFRRLIECTPIFVLGLALLVDRALHFAPTGPRRLGAQGGALVLALALICWNIGLVFNWTVGHPELRRGLDWQHLVGWQLDVPRRAGTTLGKLLFERCAFLENQGCK